MATHAKRKQTEGFSPGVTKTNPAATFNKPKTSKRRASADIEEPATKRQKRSVADMKKALEKQFHDYVFAEIDAHENKQDAYEALVSVNQMPSVVIQAEDAINAERGSITNYLRGEKERNVDMFIKYVKKNFEKIKDEVNNKPSAAPPSPSPSTSTSTSTTTAKDSDNEDEDEDEDLRTCSTSYLSILRDDITAEAQGHINDTLEVTLQRTTEYTMEFASQLQQLMLLFQTNTFRLSKNNKITFAKEPGISSNTLLPSGVLAEEVILPPSFDQKILGKAAFQTLFTKNHFQKIQSSYFGEQGQKTSSPFHEAIVEVLPKSEFNEQASRGLSAHVMKKAYQKLYTNFQNMWNGDRFSELLDQLLLHVLQAHFIHDSQQRSTSPKPQKVQRSTSPKPQKEKYSFGKKSKGSIAKIIQKEQKTRERHLAKGRMDKAAECEKRLGTYQRTKEREKEERKKAHEDLCASSQQSSSALTTTTAKSKSKALVVQDDDAPIEESLTKSRVADLKALAKHLLWEHKTPSTKVMSTVFPAIKENEGKVIKEIVEALQPYIPPKSRTAFIFKLPFILLANTLLKEIGKSEQTTKISPQISSTQLDALFVDTTTLFSLFCSNRGSAKAVRRMYIEDFNGTLITSAHKALDHKDAVFGAFFDLHKIDKVCESHALTFADAIHIIPGGKTVRILGKSRSTTSCNIAPLKPAYKALPSKDKTKAALLNTEIQAQQRQLERRREELKQFRSSTSIRQLKREFDKTEAAWTEINEAKTRARQLEFDIAEHRRLIQEKRKEMQALTRQPDDISPILVTKEENCCRLAIQSRLRLQDLDGATFCGVDNGLVATTETVSFTLNDFYYYVDLHNRAKSLQSSNTVQFKKPPTSRKITSGELKQGYGLNQYLKYINDNKPEEVRQLESRMGEHPLHVQSVDDFEANFQIHKTAGQISRGFYYSKPMIKQRRRYEFRKTRFKHKVCFTQRRQCFQNKKSSNPIMFIGDRGFGIGSRIKGFARFGGSWMAKEHGHYTKVFVTNEYNTSQTCLYCFKKLSHTLKQKNGKLVKNNGSFICYNPECIAYLKVLARDRVSAMAIGIAGLSQVLFGVTMPEFDPHPTREKSRLFNEKAVEFCKHFQT